MSFVQGVVANLEAKLQELEAEATRTRGHLGEVEAEIATIRNMLTSANGIDVRELDKRARSAHAEGMMRTHRRRISASRESKKPTRLHQACEDAGLTINMLAEEEDIPASTLRMAHAGERPIDFEKAERVQIRLGKDDKGNWRLPATRENWPKLREKSRT